MKNHQVAVEDMPRNIEHVICNSNGLMGSKSIVFCYDCDVPMRDGYFIVKENNVIKRETNSRESAVIMYNRLGGEER